MFDETCLQGFEELKSNLTSAPNLATPDWSIPFELICDASEYAISIVLCKHLKKVFHTNIMQARH